MKRLRLATVALLFIVAATPVVHHHALDSMQSVAGSQVGQNLCAVCVHGKVVISESIDLCENDAPGEVLSAVVVASPVSTCLVTLPSRAPPFAS